VSSDDKVISLAGRELGDCPVCRETVFFAENFIRAGRAFVHLRCTLSDKPPARSAPDFPRVAPPLDRGA
jgi:hypothetical protein